MATAWREWYVCPQDAIRDRLTEAQTAVVDRLTARGWGRGRNGVPSVSCRAEKFAKDEILPNRRNP